MSGSINAPNRAYPDVAVAYIVVTLSDGSSIQGSGAFISPNEVITAAHVLPTNAVSVSVDTGRAGNDRPFGYEYASSWTTDENLTGQTTLSPAQSATDLGVIVLPNDLGYETGWFSVTNGFPEPAAFITGYPDTDTGVEQSSISIVTPDTATATLEYSPSATAPGSSGGPIEQSSGGNGQAYLGGVVSTDKYGPNISGATYEWVQQQIAAHAQPTETPPGGNDFLSNFAWASYAVAFYLYAGGLGLAEAGTGSPVSLIGGAITGTGYGDTILAGPGDGAYTFGGEGGHTVINWASTVGYRAVSLAPDASGGTVVSGAGTTIDINHLSEMHFIDGDLQFDPASDAAQVYRLYLAALGRAPDPAGLANWVDQMQTNGASLTDVAAGFLGSAEYSTRFGSAQTPTQFVTLLYKQVLGRAPDAQGLANWVAAIGRGQSDSRTLVDFSESPEFKASTAAGVAAGIWVPDELAASVARLYYSTFGRAPDQAGFITNVQAVYGAASLDQLAGDFAASAEFTSRYGSTTNTQFVDLLYQNVLGRAPDAVGQADWTNALSSGALTGANVLLSFSDSAEHMASLTGVIDRAGVVFG